MDTQSKTQNPPLNPPSAGNTQADHPEIISKMQKLQMPFIANEGQVDECVAFYAKTFGGTVFVTKNGEIVYSLPSGRDVPAGASQEAQEAGRGWRQGSREAEGQGFEGCEPDGRLMGLPVSDSPKGWDTVPRVPTVNLCRDTACRVPTSPIQYLASLTRSPKGDVLGRIPEKRESRIMDYVSWFGGCMSDGRLMGLRMSDSTKGWDTVPRVPTVNVWDDTASRVPTTAARRDTACRVPAVAPKATVDWVEARNPTNYPESTNSDSPNPKSAIQNPKSTAVALKEEFIGAKVSGITGEGESVTKVSYFKGNDPSKWKSNISTYQLVNLGEIYDGIELKLKAHGNNVEKLLYVKPGADPGQIKIRLSGMQPPETPMMEGKQPPESPFIKGDCAEHTFDVGEGRRPSGDVSTGKGARGLSVNEHGELEAETALGMVRFTKPIASQEIDGKRVEVAVEYELYTTTQIIHRKGAKGAEERTEKHISHKDTKNTKEGIPGGMDKLCLSVPSAENEAPKYENDVTCNFDGFDGFVSLDPYHITSNSQPTYGFTVASYDKTKDLIIDPLLVSTFLGGSNTDYGYSLTLDTSGNVYVTGRTGSSDFPTTSGAYDTSLDGYKHEDVFVSKLDGGLTNLLASTYLGGSDYDVGNSLTLDTSGNVNVYVMGITGSSDFPTTSGAYDTSLGYYDVFVSKLDGNLSGGTAQPPTVTTGDAADITVNSATLKGVVNANGLTATAWFEYGDTSGGLPGSTG